MGQQLPCRPGPDAGGERDVVHRCERLVLGGEASRAVEVLSAISGAARTRTVRRLLGDALRAAGRRDEALSAYFGLARELRPEGSGAVPTDLAWRVARVHQEHGEPRLALDVLGRATCGVSGDRSDDIDRAMLDAGLSLAHWLLGDADDALAQARSAHDAAVEAEDARALATAHVALALALSLGGDPASVIEHYRRAARLATEAGDALLAARTDANLSHHFLADARFAEAVERAAAAASAARRLHEPALESVALENEAEGLVRLGKYDEAVDRYNRVLALAERLGTRNTAGALVGLSQVCARRAAHEQERAALQQADRLTSDGDSDRQVRILVLAYLARSLARDDLDRARVVADAARAGACGSSELPALLASGHVALANGDLAEAAREAGAAVEQAVDRRERAWLAEALELRAETDPPRRARAALREARGIWEEAGAAYDADRVLVRLAGMSTSASADRTAGRVAAVRSAAAGHPLPAPEPGVVISTFGRFEVSVDGTPVPATAWQSRRARDLLRVLVARRGRAVPRLELCELLWPDHDPDTTSHRLSVLLSIVRGVVGADALVTDRECVALDSYAVRVDVEDFLRDVADAADLRRRGDPEQARLLLADVLRRRTDEPFADAPYDDHALDLREEAGATHLQALRMMADLCRSAGDHDEAAAWLRRLLAVEPYDEDAHLTMVAVLTEGGRHGQARRAAARHRAAMADIGLHPTG